MRKTLSPGEILFRIESHVFASEEYECKSRIVQAIPGTVLANLYSARICCIYFIDKLL